MKIIKINYYPEVMGDYEVYNNEYTEEEKYPEELRDDYDIIQIPDSLFDEIELIAQLYLNDGPNKWDDIFDLDYVDGLKRFLTSALGFVEWLNKYNFMNDEQQASGIAIKTQFDGDEIIDYKYFISRFEKSEYFHKGQKNTYRQMDKWHTEVLMRQKKPDIQTRIIGDRGVKIDKEIYF